MANGYVALVWHGMARHSSSKVSAQTAKSKPAAAYDGMALAATKASLVNGVARYHINGSSKNSGWRRSGDVRDRIRVCHCRDSVSTC